MEKYEVLKNLIKYNTIKDKENSNILDYIETILTEKGLKTEYKGKNLVMSTSKCPKVGFLGHTDTVEYIDGWNTNPFELTKKDNKLYGLGVCDMKGGISAMIDAILQTDLENLKYGIKLYFTYDEEIGFGGIYELINNNENFPEFMLFGEPTDNKMLLGSKGIFEIELNFKGVKAHASNPLKGKSANINAIKFLNELNNFYEEKIKNEKNNKYEIPYTTMNIGIINGGSAKNSVPANCFVTLDFRPIKKEHTNMLLYKMNELGSKYDCEVKVVENVEPFFNDIDWIKEKETTNFITEASLVKDSKKIVLGPGPVTAHEVNEYITEESYDKLVEQYKSIIKMRCTD